jgi:hypothetical protein
MNDLPIEILSHMLSFCGFMEALVRARRVSVKFKRVRFKFIIERLISLLVADVTRFSSARPATILFSSIFNLFMLPTHRYSYARIFLGCGRCSTSGTGAAVASLQQLRATRPHDATPIVPIAEQYGQLRLRSR